MLSLVVAILCLARLSEAKKSALEEMSGLVSSSRDGIAPIGDSNFKDLVLAPSRSYHTFVLFNALSPGVNCPVCRSFDEEVGLAARTYAAQRAGDAEAPEAFFARADYMQSRGTFTKFGLKGVPHLVHFPPTGAGERHSESAFPPGNPMPLSASVNAEAVAQFVSDRLGVHVRIERPMWPRVVLALCALGALLFGAVTLGPRLWAIFEFLRTQSTLWLLACVAIYFIAVSGILFDIIRGVPTVGVNGGRPELIAKQTGMQYVAEGLLIGFLNLLAAGAIIALILVAQQWTESAKQDAQAKPLVTDSSRICVALALLFFVLGYTWIVGIYKYKSGWYRPIGMFGI